MPLALNINPKKYLQALFLACQNLADGASVSSSEQKKFKLYKEHIDNLQQLAGDYDSVIICLGAKASSLPELTNKLPLRTCGAEKSMAVKVLQSYLMHGWHSKVPVPFLLGQLGNGSLRTMLQLYLMRKLLLQWKSCSQKLLLFIQE